MDHTYCYKKMYGELCKNSNESNKEVDMLKRYSDLSSSENEADVLLERNDNKDDLLVDIVQGYPCLYNMSSKDFKDKTMKETAWLEISPLVEMTPEDAKKRWDQLRHYYNREIRLQAMEEKSGSGLSHRKKFHLYQNMSFLKPFIKRRSVIKNYQPNAQKTSEAKMRKTCSTGDLLESGDQDNINSGHYFTGSSERTLPKRKVPERGGEKQPDPLEKSLISLTEVVKSHINAKKDSGEKENIDPMDRDVMFGQFITSQIKSLSEHKKLLVQAKITDLLYKALLED